MTALEAIDLADDVGAPGSDSKRAVLHGEQHSLDSLAGGVFVGRQREMGDLKGCLEDALSGRGRLVTLVGEPGIGKTPRTAQELATYAGLRGAQVLWGRSYEERGVPPYWPWVQAIRSYVRERDPDQLRSEMGAGAADIAEVVSDLRERLPGLPPEPHLEPEQARFRLFDSITAFLRAASQSQPLVLVLDDLHWADQPSLMLLQFVARELAGARLLIIGNYRDMELSRQHPLAEALGELTRERLFQRVLLRGLTQEDVGRFIELASGVTPPTALVASVYTQTEGNPLFVTEVVRLLVQEGELSADKARETDSWTVRIPEGVREVIGRRLNRLSERCNETLTIASVIGREFTLQHLRPLIDDITEDRLLDVLEEALASRVIEELPQSVGRYQFTHALIQETLTSELSLTRRVRLHAVIAQALEEIYGEDAESHAAELASHFAEAEAVLGTVKLVHYSLVAGERALATYAHEEAQALFEKGMVARGMTLAGPEPAKDAEDAALMFGLGRAQAATLPRNQIEDVVATLARALDYYVEAGDVGRAVATAEIPIATQAGLESGAAQLVVRALALAPLGSHEARRLLCLRGRAMGTVEGDYEGAQEAFDEALAIARVSKDPVLEMRTLAQACYVDLFHLRFQECLERGLAVIGRVDGVDEPRSELTARYYVAPALCMIGDLERGREVAIAMLATAERLRDRVWLANAFMSNEYVCRLSGEWNAARDFTDRLQTISSQDRRWFGRALVEYEVGDFDQGLTYLRRSLEAFDLTTPELRNCHEITGSLLHAQLYLMGDS